MGARIKDITGSQTTFYPTLEVLVDKIDGDELGIGAADWIQARALPLSLIGNTYYQGSIDNVHWHDEITASDTFIQFTTDGGTTWIPLNTDIVNEGSTNLYFTETRVTQTPGVADAITATHVHNNFSLLQNIIDTGTGVTFLADNGIYKDISFLQIATFTSNATLSTINNVVLIDGSSNTVTITLPTAVGNEGKTYSIKCIDDTFTCDIATNYTEEIDGDTSNFSLLLHESIVIVSDNTNWWVI